jgi:uncharacterized membrane protein
MKRIHVLLFLLFLSFLPLLDLFHPGLPVGHDTPDHVARIANFYQSISEGNIIPRWAGNLNWGYGHPILMFLYPLPSYAASFFHAIGFSFVDSTKLVFAVSYIASTLAMYLFASTAWGATSGVIAAVLYGFAPYRFVDLYVRGAIGEHMAFVFPPLIFYGMLRMTKNHRGIAGGVITALSMAGLILSHNAVALMMLPLVFLYGVYLVVFEVKDRIRFLVLGSWYLVLGFILSAFFWMPAFFEGKYTLRDIVTKGDFITRFVPWQWLFVSPWNYGGGNEFTKELGVVHWVSILGGIVVCIRAKARALRWLMGGCIALVSISLLLMTVESKFVWEYVTILQKFQFPWRFLTIPVIVSPILGAITFTHVPKRFHLLIVFCLLSIAAITTASMWRAKEYIVKPEEYYSGIYESTTDTGESSPIWSVRFMERRPNAMYDVIEGEATIAPGLRKTTSHEFVVSAKSDARVVDNTLYFPGWTVAVDDRQLDLVQELIYQDPNYRGLMTFRVPPGTSRVVVSFRETKLRNVANILSISGLVAIVLYEAFRRYRHLQ